MKFTSWMVFFLHIFDVFGVKPLSGDCRILRKIKGKNGAVIDKLSDSWFNVDEEILILDVLVNEAIPEVKSDQSADDLLGQIRDIRHGVFCAVLVIEFVTNTELMIFQSKFFFFSCRFIIRPSFMKWDVIIIDEDWFVVTPMSSKYLNSFLKDNRAPLVLCFLRYLLLT